MWVLLDDGEGALGGGCGAGDVEDAVRLAEGGLLELEVAPLAPCLDDAALIGCRDREGRVLVRVKPRELDDEAHAVGYGRRLADPLRCGK